MTKLDLRVLLVEDNEAHYVLVQAHLSIATLANYDLTWAQDYHQALQLLESESFDICVLDYGLGQRNGLDFLSEPIVQDKQVPIIILTGRGNDDVDLAAMQQGVIDYLDKSRVHVGDLDRAIRYAVQRTRALYSEQQQREFLEALISIINAANSTLDFDDVIAAILDNIGRVIPFDTVDFMLVENGYTRVTHCIAYQHRRFKEQIVNSRFEVQQTPTFRQMADSKRPLLIPNVMNDENWVSLPEQPTQSYLGTPIFRGATLVGFINLTASEVDFFTKEHSERLWILAQQIAIAIQNAQEYERAQQLAIFEERNRLARELHDAVTQTLFSASVIAETLPHLVERDVAEAMSDIKRLSQMNKHALSEMRSLLVELHPHRLINEPLTKLLPQLADSILNDGNIKLDFAVKGDEIPLSDGVQVALYRIAQESMNNVYKHSRASHVSVNLQYTANDLTLVIEDNGRGFDLSAKMGANFGLQGMRERAEQNDITLTITSELNVGTCVTAIWHYR